MQFNGKYTFLSTNSVGPQLYLTSSSSSGMTYPTVSAVQATEIERWITYLNNDGSLTIQMGDNYLLSAEESVGWVTGTTDQAKAYPFRLVVQPGGELLSLEIYITDTSQWQPVRYGFSNTVPTYLVFPIAGGNTPNGTSYTTFTPILITPSLATIQQSKNAKGFDFQNVDLTGADLSQVDCTGADFTNAILDGVNFSGATLADARFIGASFNQTNLSGAILDGANFSGVNLSTAQWGQAISAQRTSFVGSTVVGCRIGSGSPGVNANFDQADFTGAVFTGSDLSYAVLTDTTLIDAVFVGAILQGVNFSQAQLGGLSKTAAADLSYAYLPNVNFTKANLFGVSFAFASLFGASSSLSNAATLEQTDFSNAYLEGINLAGASLQGAKFNHACLVNVNFTTANLSPTLDGSTITSLVDACLQGSIFSQANLSNVDLTNATVAPVRGHLNVRYCNQHSGPFPPPPDVEPLNYSPTVGLDLTSMSARTICPNGLTVAANQQLGHSLQQMLSVTSPATQWVPVSCYLPGQTTYQPLPKSAPDVVMATANVALRVCSLRHFRNLRRLADDPATQQYLFGGRTLTDQDIRGLIHYYRLRHQQTGYSTWPAYRLADGAFIGVCGLTQNQELDGVEISVAIVPEFRGNPLVKELYRAVLHYGFARLELPVIYAPISPNNLAANAFAVAMGYRLLQKGNVDALEEHNLYAITADEAQQAVSKQFSWLR
ncbi:MAG: GNAT family N-acetyltransferase [Spirosoma sp.]|nr:GNAT family N-acetyltransferase [Spirosoma sp.]